MKLNEYQDISQRTMPIIGDVTDEGEVGSVRANYALGAAGEAGEVAELVKKEVFHGHYTTVDEMKKELGDVLHYLSGLATLYGLRLEDVAKRNIDKLQKRYPGGFSEEASRERVE
ncbi:nucleoside triphosphate pyrophosphohydrolase family protein [Virgibacillus oceani]